MINENLPIILEKLTDLQTKTRAGLETSVGLHKKQVLGIYTGLTVAISITESFVNVDINDKARTKLGKLEDLYMSENNDKLLEQLELDEFSYDYFAKWVSRTLSFILGDIDLDVMFEPNINN